MLSEWGSQHFSCLSAANRCSNGFWKALSRPISTRSICVARELNSARRQINIADERLFWLLNYAADRGQSTSVVAGLWAANAASDGVMFLCGDQPLVRPELINALIEKFDDTAAWIVAPKFKGEVRNPILFHRKLFPELLQLTGDRSGRPLLDKHKRKTALLDWPEELLVSRYRRARITSGSNNWLRHSHLGLPLRRYV